MELLGVFRFFYLLGAVNALFFAAMVLVKKERKLADRVLAIWLVALSLQLLIPFLYLTNLGLYYRFAGLEGALSMAHPWILSLYVRAVIGKWPSVSRLWREAVAMVSIELTMATFFMFSAEERYQMIKGEVMLPWPYFIVGLGVLAFFAYYMVLSTRLLRVHKNEVLQVFSYRENVDLLWLRRLVSVFSGLLIFIMPISLVSYFAFHSVVFADYFFYVTVSVFVFLLGFWGYQQGEVFRVAMPESEPKPETESTVVAEESVAVVFSDKAVELRELMAREKLFLNPKLTVHELAVKIDLLPYQLSKLINQEFRCNFFEFVNSFRVEEFKRKAKSAEGQRLTILALALDCGFNSKSAFNRAFKDQTGVTPGEFLKV